MLALNCHNTFANRRSIPYLFPFDLTLIQQPSLQPGAPFLRSKGTELFRGVIIGLIIATIIFDHVFPVGARRNMVCPTVSRPMRVTAP